MADNKSREVGKLHVKVEVDVSEALTGLKALQREAREATKALRELESAQRDCEVNVVNTDLHIGSDISDIAKALDKFHAKKRMLGIRP